MRQNLLYIFYMLIFASVFPPNSLLGQINEVIDIQEYRNSYYEQKVSLFEMMPQSEDDIVFLGNSITDIGEWAEIWQDIDVKNRGISSDITAGVLARLEHISKGKPAKIFIMIGINDIARDIPETLILNNYLKILNKIVAATPSTKIYVQSLLPTNNTFDEYQNHQNKLEKIKSLNLRLAEFCKLLNVNVFYVDLYPYFSDNTGKLKKEYTNDGLHLNGSGYLRWKEVLQDKGLCCD